MIKLNPYLTFPGNAAQAIELYTEVFQVKPKAISRFKDMPPQEGMTVSLEGGERIIHAAFEIGQDMLMISDAPEGGDDTVAAGDRVHISVHPTSKEEADRIYGLLSRGGEAIMPLAIQFWGDYYGMCRDQFGVRWMINYHEAKK